MAKKLSLDRLNNGALLEMFRREMGRVAMNIGDRNTSSTAKRTITIKLDIRPDDDREAGEVETTVSSKLCPAKSVKGQFLFGINATSKEGEVAVFSGIKGQMNLDGEVEELSEEPQTTNVIDLRNKKRSV
jgi:hypothetical protein